MNSGGMFLDMTIHDFDMARFFLGDIVEVQAMAANLVEPFIAEAGDVDSACFEEHFDAHDGCASG